MFFDLEDDELEFSDVIELLKRGIPVRRGAWEKDEYLYGEKSLKISEFIILPDNARDVNFEPEYSFYHVKDGKTSKISVFTVSDILASDWEIYEDS